MDRLTFEEWCKELAAVVGPALFVLDGEFRLKMSIDLEAFYKRQSLSQEAVRDEALARVLDAAWALSAFIKHHDYPAVGSSDFNELMRLADAQDTALRALKREPNAAPTREESGQDWDAVLSAEPAPAAPDVAGMVKRLEGLPWPKLSYPDEAEMRDLGYAALPLLQELPALLAAAALKRKRTGRR